MKILRGYVFRLYPNKEQETLINKTIGSSRFIYNYLLNDRINYYKETKKSKTMYDQNKMIPNLLERYQFLKEVDSCALRTASFNQEDAYKNFFNKSEFPKYKIKGKNKRLIQIDRYYPSSQECNVCGYKNEKIKDLKIRNYECPKYHNELGRNLNASINKVNRVKNFFEIRSFMI